MTNKEIQIARETLPRWENGRRPILTAEQKQLDKELSCRDMINSILCYDGVEHLKDNRYLKNYIDNLGKDVVDRLCAEQCEDFAKAIVKRDVYTDSEGVSYNSIVWADEQ